MTKKINLNQNNHELQYLVAKTFYGGLSIAEINNAVNELMCSDIYCDEFISILDADKSNRTDNIINAFVRALRGLNVKLPEDSKQAFWQICHYHICLMAKNIKPVTNLEQLVSYINRDDISHTSNYYGLNNLLELHFSLDDMPNLENDEVEKSYIGGKWYSDNEAFISKTTREIIIAAEKWLQSHPEL